MGQKSTELSPHVRCFAIAVYISAYAAKHGGNSPTVQEIADHFRRRKATIQFHLEKLEFEYHVIARIDGKLVLLDSQHIPPQWIVEQLSDSRV